jgi:hypothetical protein
MDLHTRFVNDGRALYAFPFHMNPGSPYPSHRVPPALESPDTYSKIVPIERRPDSNHFDFINGVEGATLAEPRQKGSSRTFLYIITNARTVTCR